MASVEDKIVCGLRWKFVAVTIDPSQIIKDFTKHLLPLITHWNPNGLDQKDLKTKVFDDGITNKLVGVHTTSGADQMVLVRINGNETEQFINRNLEIASIVSLNKVGLTPTVYCEFNNGLCYGYQQGRMVELGEVDDLKMARRIAKSFAQLHSIPIPACFPQKNRLIDEYFGWANIINEEDFKDKETKMRFKSIFGSLEELQKEVTEMSEIIEQIKSPLVFSHNDTLPRNIIYNEQTDEVSLIDFEYAGPNIRAFDIGNHFAEFTGVDMSDIDFEKYPKEEFQKKWIKMYLEEVAILNGRAPESVTDEEITEMYRQVGKCALAAHVLWTVWCVFQSQHSCIDYSYMELAGLRYREYLARKQSFLSL